MIDLVVPTIGRPSLAALLSALARARGPRPGRIILVDDRRAAAGPLPCGELDADLASRITVVRGRAAGPAAARNDGWRASAADWIAFVDDDVVVGETWLADLEADLASVPADVAAVTGCVAVPLPSGRPPTDWERNVAQLATAQWITADCAYRRADLVACGGFDERFRRAYREDSDLALRVTARGRRIVRGSRRVTHPVRPAQWWISVKLQAGNADDVLMDALHGRGWRARAGAARGAFPFHVATVLAATAWFVLFARFALLRIAPGPRDPREAAAMLATSAAIPFAAVWSHLRGRVRASRVPRRRVPPVASAVLFDRDGTLIVDVPGNADPARVAPMPGAREALDALRAAGIATAVITNQPAVGDGVLAADALAAINARAEALLGPVGPVFACTHPSAAVCGCRKPAAGLVMAAARALGVAPEACVVIGDIGADVAAAQAAGARAILVPTAVTRAEEVAAAPLIARDVREAVALVIGGAA
jgi:histidinol-phosphate phosphatase family protein